MFKRVHIFLSVLFALLVVATAGAVLPSGNGQTTKARSVSVTFPTDVDTVPVKSPDHSTDSTFSFALQIGTIGGSALTTDSNPSVLGDVSAPRTLRVTAKRDGVMTMGGAVVRCSIADGTSLVFRPWFYDYTQARWIPIGASATLTAASTNSSTVAIGNMAGARLFTQIITNTGNVSWMGCDVL